MDHQSLRSVIFRKMNDGGLPTEPAAKMHMHSGRMLPCDACGEPLLTGQVECELTYRSGRPTYRLHLRCAGLWEALRLQRGLKPAF